MAVTVSFLTEIILVLSALLTAAVVYPVYRKLSRQERVNMASFQLNAEEVFTDFKIFFFAILMFIVATSVLYYGDYAGNAAMIMAGNVISLVSSFIPLAVFIRWWRRFR
ncbi:MAG: hypothetical protein ABEJ69_03880 [Candidatus Nanohaloarchaea archaeon]